MDLVCQILHSFPSLTDNFQTHHVEENERNDMNEVAAHLRLRVPVLVAAFDLLSHQTENETLNEINS